jgi:hypothetical protein
MTGSISLASSHAGGPVKGKTRGDGLLTASRALLRDLQAAFWDVPERKTKKAVVMPAAQLEHHEPAPKLEAAVVPVEPAAKALTNVRACKRARVADPDGPKPLTNNFRRDAERPRRR